MARECILCCDLRENVTEREPNCLNFSFSCANFKHQGNWISCSFDNWLFVCRSWLLLVGGGGGG